MFRKLLIANRGEIACRIMKTARRLGSRNVAVYSDADRRALHVAMADEAYRVGPPPARESYLDIDAILDAARRAGAEAVHPGYGFLSENAEFAAACEAAGIVFIGPPVAAIRAMGSKSEAKAIMEAAQVPLVPGYHGKDQSPEALRSAAAAIGFPLLVKASAGGGGRGMRVVTGPAELEEALAGARREAKAAFGDDTLLLERYLAEPRHVEVQIFADRHGNLVHLFERDCSAQRRHQKIVEEAPAPGVSEELRERMTSAAVAAARAIGYEGAGTVEFLLDRDGHFYFMEMNTRLQVEHPVTELVTGHDLVEWQLRVAAGEKLPCRQGDLGLRGHALEVRVYAEDPARRFLPSTGRLSHLRFPERDPLVRVDTGVRPGDEIGMHYDPMIAKIITWGETRERAADRMSAALADTEIAGVTTNVDFLARIIDHPRFRAGGIGTTFVDEALPALTAPPEHLEEAVVLIAAWSLAEEAAARARAIAASSSDPFSPWHGTDGWRPGGRGEQRYRVRYQDEPHTVRVRPARSGYRMVLDGGEELEVDGERLPDGRVMVTIGGTRRPGQVVRDGEELTVFTGGRAWRLATVDPLGGAQAAQAGSGSLRAPMPGRIIAVHVEPGQRVRRGAPLVVLEAMKMEHTITAPVDGTVEAVHHGTGDLVEESAELVVLGE